MKQTILSIVIVVAVAGAGFFMYRFFTSGPTAGTSPAPSGIDEQKLADYRKIETLQLDLSVLTDPFFKSLFSPSQTFNPTGTTTGAKPGRVNPFAPF